MGTALAIVRIADYGVEFIQTGDCIAVYDNEEVRVLTCPQVAHLEEDALQKWRKEIERGTATRAGLMSAVVEILKGNRYKSNIPGGYGVLNGEPAAGEYFEYGRINRTFLRHLILLTDGLFFPADSQEHSHTYCSNLAHDILQKGLQQYVQELIDLENSDPECNKYPRFKKSDDKTGLVITL